MRALFESYVVYVAGSVPYEVYVGLLALFCLGIVIILVRKGRKAQCYVARLLLVEYIFLLYCSTVLFRSSNVEREVSLTPFWSYVKIHDGDTTGLLPENIFNVAVFVPVGLLLGWAHKRMTWKKTLFIGISISVSIEILQFFLRKGLCEVDDVIHNTLGCLIGALLYLIISKSCGYSMR